MRDPQQILLFSAAILALFATVVFVASKLRTRRLTQNLALRAADAFRALAMPGLDFSNLIYGVWQDVSATEVGMVVRDNQDEPIGRVTYGMGTRARWIRIETPAASYDVDVLLTARQHVVLHATGAGQPALCSFERARGGVYRFDLPGLGVMESRPSWRLALAPRFEFTMGGTSVGWSRHIGGIRNRGVALVLGTAIPPEVRLFIMAMQGRRT